MNERMSEALSHVNDEEHFGALRLVEGVFPYPPEGLVVAAECLGRAFETVVGGQPLTIVLPLPPDQLVIGRAGQSLTAPNFHYQYPPDRDSRPSDWGRSTFTSGGKLMSARLDRLAYRFEASGSDQELAAVCQRLGQELEKWWDLAAMWLDIFTELDLLRLGLHKPRGLGSKFLAYTSRNNGEAQPLSWKTTTIEAFPKPFIVPDVEVLERCFELAGAGAQLPGEWQYIRRARSWLQAGQRRQATIDACTAAEIALANQVRRLLDGTAAQVVQELLDRCNGIVDIVKLVRAIGGKEATTSVNSVDQRLAKVRNRAAHAGYEPQHEEAAKAVDVAVEIVEHALPLGSLYNTARASNGTAESPTE
ncbi:hypothetical protein [Nocardia sienata]|uniref:hypothetical protein n=1 Tax=Nocardia sienata TaxID=248552 RepID=UPI0007A51F1B|nr:hypothetical protein [Nocardia sienata]